tara:strand:- start:1259 stop:1561 length:303 start_codon:yes stop_codon:yes gene_type:complete
MRISETRLRSVIRSILKESPRQYDHIRSYDQLESMYGGWNGQLTKLKYKIASEMWNENDKNIDSQRVHVYEQLCLDAGLGMYADRIIADARVIFSDPYFD